MRKEKILLIDDDPIIRETIQEFLTGHDFDVIVAASCAELPTAFINTKPDLVITDNKLPDGNALDLLPRLKAIDADIPIIILTGYGSIDLAVKAVKDGADHFLTKPAELNALLVIVQRLLEQRRTRRQQELLRSRLKSHSYDPFMGVSDGIKHLAEQAHRVAQTDSPILLEGETGTGKGVLARWLHQQSPRNEEPFVDLNCSSLSRSFLESELFGHEKGAFTSAVNAKPGLLETAHHGTIFLDEISDLDLGLQPKLLKVLEEKKYRRLGDVRDRLVDIRLIVASNRDVRQLTTVGQFRDDLYFRISTFPLVIKPLRERLDDIPVLAEYFLAHFSAEMGRGNLTFTAHAIAKLQQYSWPGNIRELKNVIERSILLSDKNTLDHDQILFSFDRTPTPLLTNGRQSLLDVEIQHIKKVLQQVHGKVPEAAGILDIPRSSLYQKIKKFNIELSEFQTLV